MKDSWKTVRVFISSTFKDMQAERDHLVRFVFPKLREELLKRRIHLIDVDLRWGVTSDQDAYDVCMEEIDNCHPRFICILGGRYGWIPPESDISITASEIHYGALDKLDEPVFRYFYFRDPEVTNSIPEKFGLNNRDSEKLFENLKKKIKNLYFRDSDLDNFKGGAEDYREHYGSESEKLLESLKMRIMDTKTKGKVLVGPNIVKYKSLPYYIYPCKWDNRLNRIVELESFGNQVYSDIMDSIESEFGKDVFESLNEFEKENFAMESFIEEKTENYVIGSRKKILDHLFDFSDGKTGKNYSILVGDSGSGKTALLAKFYKEYNNKSSDKLVIPLFIGATTSSTDIRLILRRFCFELAKTLDSDKNLPEDENDLVREFNSLLDEVSDFKSVVIIIDAINQLESLNNSFDLGWLPNKLSENTHIIISTLPEKVLGSLKNNQFNFEELKLPMLKPSDSESIIQNFLQRYRKRFDSEQKSSLMDKKESDNPLYLIAALEELRTLGTYDEITNMINQELPGTVQAIFGWILEHLEEDKGFRDSNGHFIGKILVSHFVSLIAITRHGLSQTELTELIDPGDTLGNIAALQRLLRPYLMHKDEFIDFFHAQFLKAVKNRYLVNKSYEIRLNQEIANYFYSKADPLGDGSWPELNSRIVNELPFHLKKAEMWNVLVKVLGDFNFIKNISLIYQTRYNISQFLGELFEHIPDEFKTTKLKNMEENLDDFSTCLELHFNHNCGSYDEKAICKHCGEKTIIHGHIDIGSSGTDYYDHYISWCTNCFWAWFWAYYNMSDEPLEKFDYKTNTY